MSRTSRNDPAPGRTLRRPLALAAWMLLALALFGVFILLGNWQVRRLHWKLGLIHDVATRVHAPPVAAPGPTQWPRIAHGQLQYLHVSLQGRFLAGEQTLVHGTSADGYGFWAIAPLRTDSGFIVLVNRGYVPASLPGTPAYAKAAPPAGEVRLTGLLRLSEPVGGFLRPNRPSRNLWYSRDVAAIAAAHGLPAATVAPYFVDAAAGASAGGAWPRAGLTVIRFPNNHLGYLITWYLMALMVAAATLYLGREEYRLRRQLKREPGDGPQPH
ncbi:MAG: SURF1 family protein [Xanthomonadaceae bacterium]|nr:SURF1 family protein [Xanthomonadaceae bacterium]